MRIIFLASAALAMAGCAKGAGRENATMTRDNRSAELAAPAPVGNAGATAPGGASSTNLASAAPAGPPDVLGDGVDAQGAGCVVFLGLADLARPEYVRASAAWRAALVRRLGEDGAAQLIGSSVNPLEDTPAAARRAAVDWCVAEAPTRR